LRLLSMPPATVSLRRPFRRLLAAGFWTTMLAQIWQAVLIMQSGFGAADAGAEGQRFFASVWMLHLIVLCMFACRWLSRNSAGAGPYPAR
jgi:hypothetical protein